MEILIVYMIKTIFIFRKLKNVSQKQVRTPKPADRVQLFCSKAIVYVNLHDLKDSLKK